MTLPIQIKTVDRLCEHPNGLTLLIEHYKSLCEEEKENFVMTMIYKGYTSTRLLDAIQKLMPPLQKGIDGL